MGFIIEVPGNREFEEFDDTQKLMAGVLLGLQTRPGEWVTAGELAGFVGGEKGTCPRVRAAIRSLRFRGEPIESGGKGFRYACEENAVWATIRKLRERANQIYAVADAMEKRLL